MAWLCNNLYTFTLCEKIDARNTRNICYKVCSLEMQHTEAATRECTQFTRSMEVSLSGVSSACISPVFLIRRGYLSAARVPSLKFSSALTRPAEDSRALLKRRLKLARGLRVARRVAERGRASDKIKRLFIRCNGGYLRGDEARDCVARND